MQFFSQIFVCSSTQLVKNVIVALIRALTRNPSSFQKVERNVSTDDLALAIEMDLYKLAKPENWTKMTFITHT